MFVCFCVKDVLDTNLHENIQNHTKLSKSPIQIMSVTKIKDPNIKVRKALPKYFDILEGKAKPKFKSANLDNKIKEAYLILENCQLCERKCKVNRRKGEKGFCQVQDRMKICSIFPHFGEEFFFVPSLTIFFWSCTFSCQFCQNWTISQRIDEGEVYQEKELAKIIDSYSRSSRNVNFVGGEPTTCLPFILKTLKYVKSDIPVVWNSNFYMSDVAMKLLSGIVDVYLSDWKYFSDKCAERLSKVKNYIKIIKRNHNLAFSDSELVTRHLILPNHFECCTKPILEYLAQNFKDKVILNLMDQYRPCYNAYMYPEISRTLTFEEFEKVENLAKELNLNFIT